MTARTPSGAPVPTPHCLQRMLERNVSLSDIHKVLTDYDRAYQSTEQDEFRVVYQYADIAVVVAPHRHAILTVLYRTGAPWRNSDGRPSGTTLATTERQEIEHLLRATTPPTLAA